MIELTPLARPYAKAMFTSAVESNNIEDIASELKDMAIAVSYTHLTLPTNDVV